MLNDYPENREKYMGVKRGPILRYYQRMYLNSSFTRIAKERAASPAAYKMEGYAKSQRIANARAKAIAFMVKKERKEKRMEAEEKWVRSQVIKNNIKVKEAVARSTALITKLKLRTREAYERGVNFRKSLEERYSGRATPITHHYNDFRVGISTPPYRHHQNRLS